MEKHLHALNNTDFGFHLGHLSLVMINLAGEFIGDEQAHRRDCAEDDTKLDPCHLIVAERHRDRDQTNAAGHTDRITDSCAPGAHLSLLFRALGLECHHGVVRNSNGRIDNSRGEYTGDQRVHIAEGAHALRNGEQQHTCQEQRNHHPQQPRPCFSGFCIRLIYDLTHEKIRNRIKDF